MPTLCRCVPRDTERGDVVKRDTLCIASSTFVHKNRKTYIESNLRVGEMMWDEEDNVGGMRMEKFDFLEKENTFFQKYNIFCKRKTLF